MNTESKCLLIGLPRTPELIISSRVTNLFAFVTHECRRAESSESRQDFPVVCCTSTLLQALFRPGHFTLFLHVFLILTVDFALLGPSLNS